MLLHFSYFRTHALECHRWQSSTKLGLISKTRLFPYDLVRVVALIMVICVHSIPDHYWAWDIGQPLFFACNGIFFILSGHFNLRTRDEGTLGRYYLRKVATIVLPVIVYTGMMIVWEMKQELFTNPGAIVERFVGDFIYNNSLSHLWFVYSLFGILLAAPFFARMLAGMNDGEKRWFFGLGMGYFACMFLLAFTKYDFGWDYPFGYGPFLFLIEPICQPYLQKCSTRKLLAGAIVPIGILAYLCMNGKGAYLFDMNPFYVTEVLCLYELLLRLGERVGSDPLISLAAKHQYGMYIIHFFSMARVQAYVMPHVPQSLPWEIVWAILVAATMLLSLAITIVVDAVVIKPLQLLMYRIADAVKRPQDEAPATTN